MIAERRAEARVEAEGKLVLMLPREHGSWALWAVPALSGLAAADGLASWTSLAFLAGTLGVFLARVPLLALLRGPSLPDPRAWLAGYSLLAAAGLSPLIVGQGRWGLVGFGVPVAAALALNVRATAARRAFSASNELLSIAALALGAPAAFYASAGELPAEAWWLWALNALYFWGPVFHVKTAALRHRCLGDPRLLPELRRMASLSIGYHLAAAGAGLGLAIGGAFPALATLPLLASLGKAWRGALQPPGRADFRALGYTEVVLAVLFLGVSVAVF